MNISITGNLGSGKSSICKILKDKGFDIVSAGSIFRELAVENGMSVEEFNQKVNEDIKKGDRSVDDLIDLRTTRIDGERDQVVFDSRLAWNFAPNSFKVFVMVNIQEAARRVFQDTERSKSEVYESVSACRDSLLNRQRLEKQRFKELYEIDYFNMKNYNLVIESSAATPKAIAEEILLRFEEYKRGEFTSLVELNPVSVFPTIPVCEFEEEDERCVVGQRGDTWFALSGHRTLFSGWREGQVFAEVDVDTKFIPNILSEKQYQELEENYNVMYQEYPTEETIEKVNLLTFE